MPRDGFEVTTDRQPGCLDENDALDYMQGRLDSSRARAIERHIDGCTPCRYLLSVMARVTSLAAAPSAGQGGSLAANGRGVTPDERELLASAGESIGDTEAAADDAPVHLLRPGQQLGRYRIG